MTDLHKHLSMTAFVGRSAVKRTVHQYHLLVCTCIVNKPFKNKNIMHYYMCNQC